MDKNKILRSNLEIIKQVYIFLIYIFKTHKMKHLLFLLFLLVSIISYSQQAQSARIIFPKKIPDDAVYINFKKQKKVIDKEKDEVKAKSLREEFNEKNKKSKDKVISFEDITNWGIYGIGNLNTESFNNLNAAGKVSGYKRLDRSRGSFTTLYFSFNKNATNNDTLLAGTFLFPDIGNTAAALTLEHTSVICQKGNTFHLLSPFIEFSHKNIKVEKEKDGLKEFSTLNYILGLRYQNWTPSEEMDVSFSVAPYLSIVNVPDEDNEDYRFLFNAPKLRSDIWSFGFKFLVQFNNFQAFADLRSVLGTEKSIPVRELRGFNSSIGIVFNADIIEK